MLIALSEQCATAERRFVGSNRGCWKNGEYDRLYTVAARWFPGPQPSAARRSSTLMKVLTDDVGILGLTYNSENLAVRRASSAPVRAGPPRLAIPGTSKSGTGNEAG